MIVFMILYLLRYYAHLVFAETGLSIYTGKGIIVGRVCRWPM